MSKTNLLMLTALGGCSIPEYDNCVSVPCKTFSATPSKSIISRARANGNSQRAGPTFHPGKVDTAGATGRGFAMVQTPAQLGAGVRAPQKVARSEERRV